MSGVAPSRYHEQTLGGWGEVCVRMSGTLHGDGPAAAAGRLPGSPAAGHGVAGPHPGRTPARSRRHRGQRGGGVVGDLVIETTAPAGRPPDARRRPAGRPEGGPRLPSCALAIDSGHGRYSGRRHPRPVGPLIRLTEIDYGKVLTERRGPAQHHHPPDRYRRRLGTQPRRSVLCTGPTD
jgi:hypothetical protein